MKTSQSFLISKDIPWEDAGKGIKRQMMGYDDKVMMVRVVFEKGAVGAPHCHHHSQVSYVVSGKFELEINGVKRVLTKEDGYFIPSNQIHGAICLEAGELIDVFSPIREDFL